MYSKSLVTLRYPSQNIADNLDARATGEQERLLMHLYHNRVNAMRSKASSVKHLKDGREDEGDDESEGEE